MLPFSRFLALYFSPGVGKQFGFFLFSFFFRVLRAIFFPNSISREKNEIVHLDTSNSNNEKKALETFETFEPRSDFWCGFPRLKFFQLFLYAVCLQAKHRVSRQTIFSVEPDFMRKRTKQRATLFPLPFTLLLFNCDRMKQCWFCFTLN